MSNRKWWIAALLSFLLPGLGQVYNGQLKKGIRFYILLLILGFSIGLGLMMGIPFIPLVLSLFALSILGQLYVLIEAIQSARRQAETYRHESYNKWYIYISALALSWFVLGPARVYLLKSNFVEAYYMPSGSMEDTLLIGDYLLADKFVYRDQDPQPGDVVIFVS